VSAWIHLAECSSLDRPDAPAGHGLYLGGTPSLRLRV
jgi:hypothetical protein